MAGPLAGLRVVDLTQVLSGPFATMLLADLGADVVKVEPPSGDQTRAWGPRLPGDDMAGYGGYFASVNRNKRSICLDLKTLDGRETLLRLLSTADVLVENFRVGVMERFDLSFETLHAQFPRLVYAALRGFGDPRTGASPYAGHPSFDIIAQAMGGLIGITGADPGHPMKTGPGIGDVFPATLATVGILAAVRHAEATGEGQFLDVAMYDGVLALCERIVYQHSYTGTSPGPQGNTHPLLCPYGLLPTSDGWVAIATPGDRQWALLAEAMGAPGLASDPAYATNRARVANSGSVYDLLGRWTAGRSTAAVVQALAGRVPCGPVNSAADIAADEHVRARGMLADVRPPGTGRTVQIVATPIKFTGTPTGVVRRAPMLGEHTAAVLAETVSPPAEPAGG